MINEGFYKKNVGLSRRRFSLLELYLQIIEETFDFKNVDKYSLTNTSEGWKFEANLNGNSVPVYIYIEPARFGRFKFSPSLMDKIGSNPTVYNFGFEVGEARKSDQYSKTTFKDYIRIVATVYGALSKFISSKNPDIITLFSQSKHGGSDVDAQKDDVYLKVLDRNKPSNYELDNIIDNVDGKIGMMLYKK